MTGVQTCALPIYHDTRLAVECDGDRYHGSDKWDTDMNRQRVLERAGWRFWRCFASTYVMHKSEVLQDLVNTLSERGIEPIGAENAPRSVYTEFRTYSSNKAQEQQLYVDEETLELDEPEKEVYIKSPENTADDNLVVLVGRNGMLIDNFESLVVQTGDHVTYIDISVPDVKIHVQIVYGADNLERAS